MYCRVAKFVGNRRELSEESLEGLEEIVMDSAKAQAILEASRSSMGMDISPLDLINIGSFSRRVISLSEYRRGLQEYLRSKMSQVAPSLSALIGEVVGARLISHAGSLTNLAKYPASTVQILGAEKALFRYRRVVAANEVVAEVKRKQEKKEKKRKKREKRRLEALAAAAEEAEENSVMETEENDVGAKKKKKKKKQQPEESEAEPEENGLQEEEEEQPLPKKKRKLVVEQEEEEEEKEEKKKKKKKKKAVAQDLEED
ncbi:hypothetical protein WISP_01527 [Willisornis vidua]|uniref:Nucleolar protein 5A n=1 Tax=Willisornis vidua TaxID=1566151 RepID=A0ABQ9E035_9PASS|nr:hypothetical protein WISP_01527 [Willisornis vidua]